MTQRADSIDFIRPDWPAPGNVHAASSTRQGGISRPPFDGFNLASHVGDSPAAVRNNRRQLRAALNLPAEPRWLQQVHGVHLVDAGNARAAAEGDASYATRSGVACAVLTADCLPVLLCDRAGTRVAAVHAGWRGLCAGVVEAAVRCLEIPGDQVLAWLGPAIGPRAFQVGPEVRDAFLTHDPSAASAFVPASGDRWLADIHALARLRLAACGVGAVYGESLCTWSDPRRFYSYRRDGATGRMASLIWLD